VPRYRLSKDADDDLIGIWSHITERNPRAADALLRQIDAACDRLVDFPLMGSRCDRFGQDLRSWVVSRYFIFYRPAGGTVDILRVLHGARDIESILGDKAP
jgi:toxin ParE1/3/4